MGRKYDVLVIGGGNAALCAVISARRGGALVLVFEGAPKFYRGGNMRHTCNMRCAHDAATEILTGPYIEDEARAARGHTAAPPTRPMNSRRFMSALYGTGIYHGFIRAEQASQLELRVGDVGCGL